MSVLDKIPTLLDPDKAADLAKGLKKDDPDWEYKVVPEGKLAKIEVYDEEGHLVGEL